MQKITLEKVDLNCVSIMQTFQVSSLRIIFADGTMPNNGILYLLEGYQQGECLIMIWIDRREI